MRLKKWGLILRRWRMFVKDDAWKAIEHLVSIILVVWVCWTLETIQNSLKEINESLKNVVENRND
jgi:hypothetical protein